MNLSNELQGLKDMEAINREQVLFWENLKPADKVSQSIWGNFINLPRRTRYPALKSLVVVFFSKSFNVSYMAIFGTLSWGKLHSLYWAINQASPEPFSRTISRYC